jgi:hypothetical protein
MSAVIWTPTPNLQWMKRQPPAGVTLPAGEQVMVLQQWFTSSAGGGQWQELPVRRWNEVVPPPTT